MKKNVKKLTLIIFVLSSMACSLTQIIGSSTPTVSVPVPDTPVVPTATVEEIIIPPAEAHPTDTPESLPVITKEHNLEENESPKYIIDVFYPSLGQVPGSETFNQIIENILDDEKSNFMGVVQENEEWREANMPQVGNDLYIDYIVTNEEYGLISILFTISTYISGAAHPHQYSLTVNFDIRKGYFIELVDLFFPGADPLIPISEYCLGVLQDRGLDPWEGGVLPVPENYRNWNIQADGLLITFDPYQVAAYAAGPQEVLIPYAELQEIIPPGGDLRQFSE